MQYMTPRVIARVTDGAGNSREFVVYGAGVHLGTADEFADGVRGRLMKRFGDCAEWWQQPIADLRVDRLDAPVVPMAVGVVREYVASWKIEPATNSHGRGS